MDTDLAILADLYLQIREAERKDQAFQLYLKQFHFMITKQLHYETFTEYYNRMTGGDIDIRPQADILAEVEELRKYL